MRKGQSLSDHLHLEEGVKDPLSRRAITRKFGVLNAWGNYYYFKIQSHVHNVLWRSKHLVKDRLILAIHFTVCGIL